MAVTGGASGFGRIFVSNGGIAAGYWAALKAKNSLGRHKPFSVRYSVKGAGWKKKKIPPVFSHIVRG
jgi:hypothetical protein